MRTLLNTAVCILLSATAVGQDVYDIRMLDIRPQASDYAPVLYEEGFVMTSLRYRDQTVEYTEKGTGKPFADMYYVPWDGQDVGKLRVFDESLATPVHDGPATFSPGGDTICFTRNLQVPTGFKDRLDKNNKLGLFFSTRTGGEWSEPVPYEFNSENYSLVHPTFSRNGQRIYFASGNPEGYGGSDIHFMEKTPDGWSAPMNIGAPVNGPHNELFPFAANNGVLYLSSNRPGGAGALDIYITTFANGEWNEPEALPAPINSEYDDLGFTCDRSEMTGLFSSNRSKEDQIYSFHRTTPPFSDCKPQKLNNYCYQFQDIGNFKNTSNLPIEYRWNMGDGHFISDPVAKHCYEKPGTYIISLDLVDISSQNVFYTEATYTLIVEDHFQPVISLPDSLRAGKKIEFSASNSNLPNVDIASYHWDLGDGTEHWGKEYAHEYKEEGSYTIRLDVLSKPNAVGRIMNYCVTKKVNVIKRFKDSDDGFALVEFQSGKDKAASFDYEELPYDGFELSVQEGENVRFTLELVTSEERMDSDHPFFAKLRNEYNVIERYIPERGLFSYSVGETETLEEAFEIYQKLMEWQYLDAEVLAMKMEKLRSLKELDLDLETVEEYNNTVLTASMVYFDVGKDTFKPLFLKQLDKLVQLMTKYHELDLVISAHTDSEGSRPFNQDLSERRANKVLEFFLIEDVDRSRLTSIGYGEDHPIADNSTNKGRKLNRRVEFKIVLNKADLASDKD
jgi:outer membrane protein OmpA-like peptidoglycan-associated protein